MWSYLWDLADGGIADSTRRLRDLGLDAVSVATAYHSFQQLRPHRPGRRLLIEPEAALYFEPDPTLYTKTSIRPRVAPLAAQGQPLAALRDAAGARGLDLISWTVCLHNSDLCRRYPHLSQQTAYGDGLGWVLCPGCDDVRAYVVGLCRDLACNYGVKRIELETCSFGAYGHAHHHAKDGVRLGAVGTYLYSLSFSPGCCRRARDRGIDVDGLRAWVREQLDPVFASGQPLEGEVGERVAGHPALGAFQQLREELVAGLVAEIRGAVGPAVEVSFLLMGDRWQAGIRADLIAPHAERLGILAYTPSPDEVERRVVAALAAGVPAADRLVVGLCLYPPASPDGATLAATAAAAVGAGVRELSFYNYGIAPPACLEWVKSCIRSI